MKNTVNIHQNAMKINELSTLLHNKDTGLKMQMCIISQSHNKYI